MQKKLTFSILPILIIALFMAFDAPPNASITIIKNPDHTFLNAQKVHTWPTWEKEPSTFVWQFAETEKAFILAGKVLIRPEGSNNVYLLQKGDFVTFSPGLRCHWHVLEPFKKHVTLEESLIHKLYWKVAFKIQHIPRLISQATNDDIA
jgi:uncharacterized protein